MELPKCYPFLDFHNLIMVLHDWILKFHGWIIKVRLFRKYIDAYLYALETITSILYTWLHFWLYCHLVHFKSCKKNVHSSQSVVKWPRYRALCTCTSLLQKRRPVRCLRLKRLYIGAYGTFKFEWSYILRYVWIYNSQGYLLVSIKLWRECYAVLWRTIYSSKFAYFGKYIDPYLYAYETITSLLDTWLH